MTNLWTISVLVLSAVFDRIYAAQLSNSSPKSKLMLSSTSTQELGSFSPSVANSPLTETLYSASDHGNTFSYFESELCGPEMMQLYAPDYLNPMESWGYADPFGMDYEPQACTDTLAPHQTAPMNMYFGGPDTNHGYLNPNHIELGQDSTFLYDPEIDFFLNIPASSEGGDHTEKQNVSNAAHAYSDPPIPELAPTSSNNEQSTLNIQDECFASKRCKMSLQVPALSAARVQVTESDISIVPSTGHTGSMHHACKRRKRQKRKRCSNASSVNSPAKLQEDLTSCQFCGAPRQANGQFELPLDIVSKNQPFDVKIQLIREAWQRYSHHVKPELLSKSYEVLRSFKAIITCLDNHCEGSSELFNSRHPRWALRSFHNWNCTGKEFCDFIRVSARRKRSADRNRRDYSNRKTGNSRHGSSSLNQTLQEQCSLCGISRNEARNFMIPRITFVNESSLGAKLQKIRELCDLYNHHGARDLESNSYNLLLSMKHTLICFDQHCGGNITEFENRHPNFKVITFRLRGCSGYEECIYLELAPKRRLAQQKKCLPTSSQI